jgi:large exoprotein involved in heme utilization and adhesion
VGSGDAGDVNLTATNLVIDVALISSSSIGTGDGGDIRITARNQNLGAANVLTSAFGDGSPGDVRIDGDTIVISGGQFGATPGSTQASGVLAINATTSIESDGGGFLAISSNPNSFGGITLRAPLILLSQGRIDTQAFGDGLAGQVLVEADRLLLDRVMLTSDSANGPLATGLVRLKSSGELSMLLGSYSASVNGTADGGRIEISGRDVHIDGAVIQTDTGGFGTGDAGQIAITAVNSLTLDTATGISSSSGGEGRGGNVTLTARDISISDRSEVLSESRFAGDAGQISIAATGTLSLDTSDVFSRAFSGTGNGGSVRIDVGRLVMTDSTLASDSLSIGRAGTVDVRANEIALDGGNRGFTGISSDALSLGDAGTVNINVGKLTVANSAYISSSSFSEASAGDVNIVARDISVLNSGTISSVGFFAGDAGNISIVADTVLIQGEAGSPTVVSSAGVLGGKAGDITLQVRALTLDSAAISSDTFAGGDAGNLTIKADAITLKNFSSISSSTNSFGNAGSVQIDAGTLSVLDRSLILSAATSVSDGDAGQISIRGDRIVVGQGATITTATFSRGDAGAVSVVAKSLLVDGGDISSSAGVGSTGFASTVSIVADELDVVNRGSITTLSANTNKAGEVTVAVKGRVNIEGEFSLISSENISDDRGDAGTVRLTAGNLRIANGAAISTNSIAGAAGDIEINVPRPGLVVLEGGELPGAILTSSGPGTGGRITLVNPLAIISNGGKILALGEQRGANVLIQSRYFINSTDRSNVVDVAGDFQLQTGLYDVSSGTVAREISVLDASKVLRGQCPAARSTGAVSQLITRPVGPYAREGAVDVLERPLGSVSPGSCP